MEPLCIRSDVVLAMHSEQIAEHGGTKGIRDEGLLVSALARPRYLLANVEGMDMASLAASYAFGIAKNHPFLDGNKRTGLVVSVTFLNLNGLNFDAKPSETYTQFLGLAEGLISEEHLAIWLRARLYSIKNK